MNNGVGNILIVDDELVVRDSLLKWFSLEGYHVKAAASARDALELLADPARMAEIDVALLDIKMPGMDGIEAATQLYLENPVPVILVSAHHDPALIERAEADHVMAYLVKPIKQADLGPAIALAMRRFEQFEALRREAADLRQALEDRKLIERAKGILMLRSTLDEPTAFRRLQKVASEKNLKLAEVARMIVTTEEALGGT